MVTSTPTLHPIDYKFDKPIILSVDTSKIVVGIILSQEDKEERQHPARYGSIPDLQPIAVLNCWIQGIKLYTFELVHVLADKHRLKARPSTYSISLKSVYYMI